MTSNTTTTASKPPSQPFKLLPIPFTHTGLTVTSLSRSLDLFHKTLGLPLLRSGRITPPISTVCGINDAIMSYAHLGLPGGHTLEPLEFESNDLTKDNVVKSAPNLAGSWHLALVVDDLDAVIEAVKPHGFELANGVRTLEEEETKGVKISYLRDSEGVTLEFIGVPKEMLEGRPEQAK